MYRAADSPPPASGAFVRELTSVTPAEVVAAGRKGATLGGLAAAELPVPAGFVVTVRAYRAFLAETGVGDRIAERLAEIDTADPVARRQAAADIHVVFDAAPLPEAIRSELDQAYARLSDYCEAATVAVRSSPANDDSAAHLLAHMNDTFLCVHGEAAVLGAVRRCWGSAYGERSLTVREKLGLAHDEVEMAVVVQRQVAATRSGVMVTSHPHRGEPDRIEVQATYGLGEAASAGLVTPDRYAVDRHTLNVIEREVNRKDVVVEEAPPGGATRTRAVIGEQATLPALLDRELRQLAGLAIAVEDELHAPQVVDWAIDRAGHLWILQATPLSFVRDDAGAAAG